MTKASKVLLIGILVCTLMVIGGSLAKAQEKNAPSNVLSEINAILAKLNLKATDAWVTPFGMYEVIVENSQGKKKIVFFAPDLKYYLVGRLYTADTNEDITFLEAYKRGSLPAPKGVKVDTQKINLKNALFIKGKKGTKDVILFADPLDPFSRKEIEVLKSMGFNIYIKLVPVYGPSSVKAFVYLFRLKKENPEKAVEHLGFSSKEIEKLIEKSKNIDPTDEKYSEEAKEVDENQKEAELLGIRGVPAFIIDGKLYAGFMGKRLIQFLLAHE